MEDAPPHCHWCGVPMHGAGDVLRCPQCGWRMPPGGVCPSCLGELGPPDEDGCRACLNCRRECWPPRSEYLQPSFSRQAQEAWHDEQRYKRSISKPGGGSDKAGRKRAKPKYRQKPWNEEGA